ncbi:hypothetical protein HDU79_001859 [Rhizoclosmatium sp. JEL0117]|nr:hypothetical protein HDU79_001859 [Rhizoclosmatium sp. JEL0117]
MRAVFTFAAAAVAFLSSGVAAEIPTATSVRVSFPTNPPAAPSSTPRAVFAKSPFVARVIDDIAGAFHLDGDQVSSSLVNSSITIGDGLSTGVQGPELSGAESIGIALLIEYDETIYAYDGIYDFKVYDNSSIDATSVLAYNDNNGASPVGVFFEAHYLNDIWFDISATYDVPNGTGNLHFVLLQTESDSAFASFDLAINFSDVRKRDIVYFPFTLRFATADAASPTVTTVQTTIISTTVETTIATSTIQQTTLSTTASETAASTTTTPTYLAQVTGVTTTTDVPTSIATIASGAPSSKTYPFDGKVNSFVDLLAVGPGSNKTDYKSTLLSREEVRLSFGATPFTFNGSALIPGDFNNQALLSIGLSAKNVIPGFPTNFTVYDNKAIDVSTIYYANSSAGTTGFTVSFGVAKTVPSLWYAISAAGDNTVFGIHVDIFTDHQALASFDVTPLYLIKSRKRSVASVWVDLFTGSARFNPVNVETTTVANTVVSTVSTASTVRATTTAVLSSVSASNSVVATAVVPITPAQYTAAAYVPPPTYGVPQTANKPANLYSAAGKVASSLIVTFGTFVLLA